MKISTTPLSVKNIEEYALNTRKNFNIGLDTFFPVVEILEKLNNSGYFNFVICEKEQMLNKYAYYNVSDNTIYVREDVYNECLDGVYRSNFTLAHEYFHYIQAKELKFNFTEVEECKSYCDIEWQANEFAAQLLIPSYALNLEPEEIARRYHVSLEAAAYRKLKERNRQK